MISELLSRAVGQPALPNNLLAVFDRYLMQILEISVNVHVLLAQSLVDRRRNHRLAGVVPSVRSGGQGNGVTLR